MWDDSFRWNRLVRRVMGAIVLAALGAGLIFVGRTTVARQLTHAVRERIGQLGMTEEPRVTVDARVHWESMSVISCTWTVPMERAR